MSKKSETQSLETYLSQIEREMPLLPRRERESELREIEAHLRAMIEARQLAGAPDATAEALKQFGPPRKVGRALQKAWQKERPEAWWRAVLAPIIGLLYAVFLGIFWTGVCASSMNQHWIGQHWIGQQSAFWRSLFLNLSLVGYASIPVLVSITVGATSPKHGTKLVLPSLALIWFIEYLFYFSILPVSISIFCLLGCSSVPLTGLWGVRFGARHTLKHLARIADAK